MEGKTKPWNVDTGGITLCTAFKNLSMILVIIALLTSSSFATNTSMTMTTRSSIVRALSSASVCPADLSIRMPQYDDYNGDKLTVEWSNYNLKTDEKAYYKFIAQGPGINLDCKVCIKKRIFDRFGWGFGGFGHGGYDPSCQSGCGECQTSDSNVTCNIKTHFNSTYNLEVELWNNSSDSYERCGQASRKTSESVWPFTNRNVFQRLTQEELDKYNRYKEYPINCLQWAFNAYDEITKYQILLSGYNPSDSSPGKYKTPDEKNRKTFQGKLVHNGSGLPDVFVFGRDENAYPLYADKRYYFIFRVYIRENFLDTHVYTFETEEDLTKNILFGIFITILVLTIMGIIGHQAYHRYFSPILKRGQSMELPLLMPDTVDDFGAKPIKLAGLFEEIDKRLADDSKILLQEFNQLEISSPVKTCEVAKDGLNTGKNRYNNILPFDETRVILDEYRGLEGSNYINASYIHGYNKPKEFIAAQGPRGRDRDSFWRMVWEKNVNTIVMVTNCIEAKQKKCCRYWPDTSDPDKTIILPKVGMKIVREDERSRERNGYVMRVMRVSKDSLIFTMSRLVTQFHFSEWSDMGCPNNPDNLISLAKAVKERAVPNSPTIVHCSAGVGRTGTFIGLCNLMEEMKVKDSVDVYQAVYRMRQNRMNMVQTLVQYEFLYKCVQRVYEQRWQENSSSRC